MQGKARGRQQSRQLASQQDSHTAPGCTPHHRERVPRPPSIWAPQGWERQFKLMNKAGTRTGGNQHNMNKHKMVIKHSHPREKLARLREGTRECSPLGAALTGRKSCSLLMISDKQRIWGSAPEMLFWCIIGKVQVLLWLAQPRTISVHTKHCQRTAGTEGPHGHKAEHPQITINSLGPWHWPF